LERAAADRDAVRVRTALPTGTLTFLFTDVEGSTRLLRELGAERYGEALAAHRRIVREACAAQGGVEVDTQGDAFFLAFPTAPGALETAAEITGRLASGPVHVRIGLHTGTALVTDEGYVGEDVHLAARVAAAAHGGQILLTAATAALSRPGSAEDDRPFLELGEHRLKDVPGTVAILQLGRTRFPPLATSSSTRLPRPASSFVGRESELAEVLARLGEGVRLLTLTGPGGSGKTRLALEAAHAAAPEYEEGVFWADLTVLRDPARVTDELARVLGARNGLAAHVGERRMLVVVDNFEQVVSAAPDLSRLLSACPGLSLLVTSRELLRVRGEVELQVPPLPESDAVVLFCDRAQLEPSEDIAELCARLDALPLAVELAAARTKALSPGQIVQRLSRRLDLLQGGRDADPRQQTLRATIAWSYDLLREDERRLFARLSALPGGCTLDVAELVVAADLDALQSLVEKSLLRTADERYWMLETIRGFAAEKLDAGGLDDVLRRLRALLVATAGANAEMLHGAEESAVSARLAPDYENIRAAVEHALAAGEPDDVGLLVGWLYPFLISHGHLGDARTWVEGALAARDRLSSRGLVETLSGAGEVARFGGDLGRAVELKEELLAVAGEQTPLRPNWRAATLADLCEIALDQDDVERARRHADACAAEGGGARAELCQAEIGLRLGDLRAAESHGLAALDGLDEGAFNFACALEILGETARRRGDVSMSEARFRDALRSFAALRDSGGIADCLDGLSRVVAAAGDEPRAGRLAGAAQRLRETSGRRATRADVALPPLPVAAQDEGHAMTMDEAVSYALAGSPEM
jgi:predicted ATPase/class 3 adenylate cyclase